MLNGENDIQTPARAALAADAAVAAAGNTDHKVVIYPGMAHTMNITPKFHPEFGDPDQQVVDDIRAWLRSTAEHTTKRPPGTAAVSCVV